MKKSESTYIEEEIEMMTGRTIGTRIRQARENITQDELSKLTGISISSIKNWERDIGEPALKYIRLIATKLKVSPIVLTFGNTSDISEDEAIILMNQITSLQKDDKRSIEKIIEGLVIRNMVKKQNK